MGTRNLTVVKLNKKVVVAQYGQWDGYLEGQGKTVFNFIINRLKKGKAVDRFKLFAANCRFLSADDVKKTWVECGADPDSDMVSMKIAEVHTSKYPALSRDTGAEVLNLILNGEVTQLQDSIDFAKDGLFCEYAYILDLDTKTLEIHTGGIGKGTLFASVKFKDVSAKKLKQLQIKERGE